MKKRLYFDTSALIKEFKAETSSHLVNELITAARDGKIQIVTSIWTINEIATIIDRLARLPKTIKGEEPLSKVEIQEIIATISQRVTESGEQANFFFVQLDHAIVANSREIITAAHVSAPDALHVYTGWVYDCDYFVVHDAKIVNRIKNSQLCKEMTIIDLANQSDCDNLHSTLIQ